MSQKSITGTKKHSFYSKIFISEILYLWSLETKDSDVNYSSVVFKRQRLHNMLRKEFKSNEHIL